MDLIVGQFIALLTFFVFPAIQYLFLKRYSKREGRPQLWYLPRYGFRLVIRNLPRKKILSDIKYKSRLRTVISSGQGTSVASLQDEILVQGDDFFLFPGTDQVLISFRLDCDNNDELGFILTDKMGLENKRIPIKNFDRLICDYSATLENFFNFDIKIAYRAELKTDTLVSIWKELQKNNTESLWNLDRIRSVG